MKALEAWRPFQPIDKISMNTFSMNLCMMTTCNFCFIKCVITINIHINLCNDTLSIKRLCMQCKVIFTPFLLFIVYKCTILYLKLHMHIHFTFTSAAHLY